MGGLPGVDELVDELVIERGGNERRGDKNQW